MSNNQKTSNADLLRMMEDLVKQVTDLKAQQAEQATQFVARADQGVAKNHRAGKANEGRTYQRTLANIAGGNIPAQQQAIADILIEGMEFEVKYTETEVFAMLEAGMVVYPCLTNAKQHVTYLFRYYRGLKAAGKYAGYTARGFLRG